MTIAIWWHKHIWRDPIWFGESLYRYATFAQPLNVLLSHSSNMWREACTHVRFTVVAPNLIYTCKTVLLLTYPYVKILWVNVSLRRWLYVFPERLTCKFELLVQIRFNHRKRKVWESIWLAHLNYFGFCCLLNILPFQLLGKSVILDPNLYEADTK